MIVHPTRSRRVVGSNPIWNSAFFRVYVSLRIYIISCCCYFSVSKFKNSRIKPFSLFLQKHEYRLEFGQNRGPVLPQLLRNLLDFHEYFNLTIRLSSMDFLRVIKVATSSAIVYSREIESKSNWFGIILLVTQSFYLKPLHRLFENTKKRPSFSYREVCSLCTKIY